MKKHEKLSMNNKNCIEKLNFLCENSMNLKFNHLLLIQKNKDNKDGF